MFKEKKLIFKDIRWFFGYDAIAWYPIAYIVKDSKTIRNHETVHLEKHQYKFYKYGWHFGLILYRFLYFLVLPIGWNPIRKWAEKEALIQGNGCTEKQAEALIKLKYFLW